jgi:hypothetical protein
MTTNCLSRSAEAMAGTPTVTNDVGIGATLPEGLNDAMLAFIPEDKSIISMEVLRERSILRFTTKPP